MHTPKILKPEGGFSASHWGAFFARFEYADAADTPATDHPATTADRPATADHPAAHTPAIRLAELVPSSFDRAPSPNLAAAASRALDPRRATTALIRRSVLERGFAAAPRHLRGRESLVPIPTELALDLAAAELRRVYAECGPAGIYGGSYGWNSVGALHNPPVLLARLLNLLGGFVGREQTYSTHCISPVTPGITGCNEATARPTNWASILANTELLVLWGADVLKTTDIAWAVPTHEAAARVGEFARKIAAGRASALSIDAQQTATATALGARTIFASPGTDAALAYALCASLLRQGLADENFAANYCENFDAFAAFVRHREAAFASASGQSTGQIDEIARQMAGRRTMIMAGWGMQRALGGELAHAAIIALAALLGQIGLPGGGYGCNYHYSDCGARGAMPGILGGISAREPGWPAPAAIAPLPVSRIWEALAHPLGEYLYRGERRRYPHIRSVFWAGGNPLHHHPGRAAQLAALAQAESFIVADTHLCASAQHADLFIPAALEIERADLAPSACGRYIFAMQQLLAPPAGVLSDYEIFAALAERLGVGEAFCADRASAREWLLGFYEQAREAAAFYGAQMPSYQEFERTGVADLSALEDASEWVKMADFRAGKPLATPSGKITLKCPSDSDLRRALAVDEGAFGDGGGCVGGGRRYASGCTAGGCDGGDSPANGDGDRPADRPADRAPLILLSPHSPKRLHSQLFDGAREEALMHPQTAAAWALEHGAAVRLYNDRGAIYCTLRTSEGVAPGVVCVCQGAWFAPDAAARERGEILCRNGDVNVLISGAPAGEFSQGNRASALVRAAPWHGE